MRLYEPEPGQHIHACAMAVAALTELTQEPVKFAFNGIEIVAEVGQTTDQIAAQYDAICEARRVAYEASPEGQEAKRRREEADRARREAFARPIPSFDCIDSDGWEKHKQANMDGGYGECVVRVAAEWAHAMDAWVRPLTDEKLIRAQIASVAQRCFEEVERPFGITGFQYGCVMSVLAKVWRHGDALRRWHNLKTQLGNEGERANESGGVLNPALLTIGGAT